MINPETEQYTLTISQHPATADQAEVLTAAYSIRHRTGYDNEGNVIPLQKRGHPGQTCRAERHAGGATFTFDNVYFQPRSGLAVRVFSAGETGHKWSDQQLTPWRHARQ